MGKSALLVEPRVERRGLEPRRDHAGVLVFSLEMTKEEVASPHGRERGEREPPRVIAGKLTGLEAEAAWKARAMLSRLPLVIDDATGLTPSRLRSRLRRAMMRFNNDRQQIALVAIDSLQWMRAGPRVRHQHRRSFARARRHPQGRRRDSKGDRRPHAVAAQLNRDVGKRTGKELRPRLTDLAESGDVEKHAHNVIGVHRPEYYDMDKDALSDEQKRLAEVCVLKQRDGDTGLVALDYVRECTRFQARGGSHVSRL
jgi:replicative DNA helicase